MKQEKKIKKFRERQLKVHQRYISRSYHRYVIFPEIRLCGKWLQDMGFNCGESVIVCHKKNKIIITPDNKMDSD
ncbi:SymE family type I addiction module toxin [uncultured Chryseobacterium sp.]|uniref:SymE family type I addiction module toxin n=1 Tax=uncultured Chryseobacterium sp. TaxID=259322 RepID=UPI00345BA5BB